MSSRVLVQLLLSLMLLVSQQLALGHGYAHLQRAASEQLRDEEDGSRRGPATDQLCAQCATFHQLAYGLGSVPTYSFKAVAPSYPTFVSASTPPACLQVVCVFQPRAPPRA
jgi:hypothetical protein